MSEDKKGTADRRQGVRTGSLNIRFSDTARYILYELQEYLGLSQASIIEMLLREEARRRGLVIPGSGADLARQREREALAQRIRENVAAMGGPVDDEEDHKPTKTKTNRARR